MGDESTIAVGDVLDGKYEITDVLGEGAMGVVYEALHRRLQRTVALKTVRAEVAQEPELIERFEREARAASAIGHANIVQVYDAGGEPGGLPYLVMENLVGQSLGELLHSEGTLSLPRACELVRQVLAGLEAAHDAGIVHRDLKPDNIFVTADSSGTEVVKILDFGISKILDVADPAIAGDSRATRAGTVMGTPLYMSPEQASGGDVDHRTDLWAVICVLYECISGRPPFTGENYNQIMAAVLRGEYVALAERCPDVPPELDSIVHRSLQSDRDSRFASAAELASALAQVPRGPTSQQDSQEMLAAFDNLADRFLQQEEQDSVDQEIPPGPADEPAATPAPAALFAPPDAGEAMSLSLELDQPERRPTRETPGPPRSASASSSPRKRSASQTITRSEPRSVGGTIAKLFLLLLVVAAGGAGYRYYTLGYILAPRVPAEARLSIEVLPQDTRIFLDGEQKTEASLSLVSDETFQLRLRADKRLAMQGEIKTKPGMSIQVEAQLGHTLPTIGSAMIGRPTFSTGEAPGQAVIDAALSKLETVADCGLRLSQALDAVVAASTSKEELQPLPSALTDECVMALELSATAEPLLEELDAVSMVLRTSASDYNKAVRDLASSAGARGRIVRQRKRALRRALEAAEEGTTSWRQAMNTALVHWLAMDAARVQLREPQSLHAQLRELAVRSDAWMRAHLAGAAAEKQRAEMKKAFASASSAAAEKPDLYKASGGAAYLRAIKPLVENEPGDEALFWHNQAVGIFNQLLIPIPMDVETKESQ